MNMFKRQSGFNLIELMVAMVIGVFLIGGALRIYTQSQAALLVSERNARLQENARFALTIIEDDVRAAQLWGMTNDPVDIFGRAGPLDPININVISDCAPNWSVNLALAIEGSNNANPFGATCIPATQYQANTDVLIVRHADEVEVDTANLQPGTLYVRSSSNSGQLFVGTTEPTSVAVDAINNELVSTAYWISNRSDADPNVPSLRRSFLTTTGANPTVISEEVISGVEDMQVQYGIDTDADDSVNMYVDFDDVTDANTVLVARVWLRLRTEQPEVGFEDNSSYIYADGTFSAAATAIATGDGQIENFRRLLVTKTIELRNRRAPELVVGVPGP